MADIFDVISDATRRDILALLLKRTATATPELSVSDLVAHTKLSQPTVSKQLKVLRDAGLPPAGFAAGAAGASAAGGAGAAGAAAPACLARAAASISAGDGFAPVGFAAAGA